MGAQTQIQNLSNEARDQRLRTSVVLFTFALAASVWMVKAGVSPAFRLALIIPFWFSMQSFFSALYRT